MRTDGRYRMMAVVLCAWIALSAGGGAWAKNTSASPLAWPAVTNQTKPWTRWWWMGSIANERDLTTEMAKYAQAGLGGLEITPIYGVKGYEDRFIDYLTPAWMEMLVHTLKEGQRLDLGIDMATGNGWPFGGQWVGADDACRNVVYSTYALKEGERLNEPVTYIQKPMLRAIGRRMNISELKEPIRANENLQTLALEQVRFEKALPLEILMAYGPQGQALDLTEKVGAEGELDWTAPAGAWTLYAVFQSWHGKMVERAGPGGEGNVIDHFSREVLGRYLSKFDRAYAGYDVTSMRAYFNDSYEVDDAAGESNWTSAFLDHFQRRRGYDLREHLPALFGQGDEETIGRLRCDYRETVSDLLLEEFTIPWRRWAESHGATIRNQAHGAPANLLDLYAASGIPETEGADILGFKLASSAAHLAGKPLASCEAATWMNEHFQGTLGEAKQWADRYFLGGINHICYHGTTFSPTDEAWPGWMFYASVHFGPTNSFWNDFSALNQYVTRCQSFLQVGAPDNDVLVYWPIYDSWSQVGRSLLQHYSAQTPRELQAVASALWEAGYAFDYISDRQLADVRWDDGMLRIGDATYKTVVVPQCQHIPLETFEKLLALAEQGAVIIVQDQLPADVPGRGTLDARRREFQKRVSQLNFSGQAVREARLGRGRLLVGGKVRDMLLAAGVERETMVDRGFEFVRRDLGDGKCYFVLNTESQAWDGWVPVQDDAASVAIFDAMHGHTSLAALRRGSTRACEVYVQLAPGQSCILRTFDTAVDGASCRYLKTARAPQEMQGTWTVCFVQGGPDLPATTQTQTLGSWTDLEGEAVKTFSGTARYTMAFKRPQSHADAWRLDLGRVCASARVTLNGKELGTLISAPFQITIGAAQLNEKNVLEIEVSNLMANRIADLDRRGVNYKKFYNVNFPARRRDNRGSDGYFNASKWPLQESGLIGPVTLMSLESVTLE
jgi:alpha-L-rhamnosidase